MKSKKKIVMVMPFKTMPSNCLECKYHKWGYCLDGKDWSICGLTGKYVKEETIISGRTKTCPLKEIE